MSPTGTGFHPGSVQAEDDVLQWQHRWPRVQQRLRALDADVVCLQEVNHFAECFAPFMASLGYAGALVLILLALFWSSLP